MMNPDKALAHAMASDEELSLYHSLSPRQREVAKLLAKGLTNKAVAKELGLSYRTVEIHRGAVTDKLQCSNFISAALILFRVEVRAIAKGDVY